MKYFTTLLLGLMTFSSIAQVDVTFELDMSGESVSADGVHIAGDFNSWNTSSHMLTTTGGSVYSITVSLTAGDDIQYKFLNGNNWGTEETPPAACSVGSNNRIFTVPGTNTTLPITSFGGCPTPNETQEVTFNVDMSGITIASEGVHVTGNFNGWQPGITEMSNIGDNVFSVTVTVLSSISNLQYKYLNGNNWGTEETVPVACANDASNRDFTMTGAGAFVTPPNYFFGTCNVSSILAVELSYFEGFSVEEDIKLIWGTLTEIDNIGFEVEYSVDGLLWETLCFVDGNGSTNDPQSYEFIHRKIDNEINYYRIKQIDFDGKYDFSSIITIRNSEVESHLSIFPNPVEFSLVIKEGKGELFLFDQLGKLVYSKNILGEYDEVDVSTYMPGIYSLLVIHENGSTINRTFIKQ